MNGPSRFASVFRAELMLNLRRVMFWIWAAIMILVAWGMSSGTVQIRSGDSSVGGTKAWITSEFAVGQQLGVLTLLFSGFFVAVAAGMVVIQDEEWKVGELLHATPLRPGEYLLGKFLGVFVSIVAVMLIQLLAMMLFFHVVPNSQSAEIRGPFQLENYLKPAALFMLPTLIFLSGVSFWTGERFRRPILVFVLPVALVCLCLFLLWMWSPSWLSPRWNQVMMLLDPTGFRWLRETYLDVDRGAQFYNHESIPLEPAFVISRLAWSGVGVLSVLAAWRHFARSLRGVASARPSRLTARVRAKQQSAAAVHAAPPDSPTTTGRPDLTLAELGMAARPTSWFRAVSVIARSEFLELRRSPGLYLFSPLILLQSFGAISTTTGFLDSESIVTSGLFATQTHNVLALFVALVSMFYLVESLQRERSSRFDTIALGLPTPISALVLGKYLANLAIALVILLLTGVMGVIIVLFEKNVPLELSPYLLVWGVLLLPTLLLWTAFVAAVWSITGNRYLTYALSLAVIFFTGYRQFTGKMNWVGNWILWGTVPWSDISRIELDRSGIALNRLFALAVTGLLLVVAIRYYPRRERDPIRLMHQLRLPSLLRTVGVLLAVGSPAIVLGVALWMAVDAGPQGNPAEKAQKDYWRKNLATYKDAPTPDLQHVEIDLEVFPATRAYTSKGTYRLANGESKPLPWIALTPGLHWRETRWTLNGQPIEPENRAGLMVFPLKPPLATGANLTIGFEHHGRYPDGLSKNGGGEGTFILPSSVVLTGFTPSFAPLIGFQDGVGVDDENKTDAKEYADDFYVGQTDSFLGARAPFTTKIKVTGPADFRFYSVGELISEEQREGKRTVVWSSDYPVNFFNVIGGRWVEKRGEGTVIHHHPAHGANVDEMLKALNGARKYYSAWFAPFPWKELKLSEFAGLSDYAQGFPTNITFSESIGFLTRSNGTDHAAFAVTAHEAAHQWWGNLIAPGEGPGGNLLSEGSSHFSTILLMDQVLGPAARMEFCRRIESRYNMGRQADSERPLVKIDGSRPGDTTVTYDKTGMVFWMLLHHMGRDRMLSGVREFFSRYAQNRDHPVLQDFLEVLRPFAPDPAAYDAFTKQWFLEVVVPEYRLSETKVTRDSAKGIWTVSGRIENLGTGVMPVEVAATRGERISSDGKLKPDYQDQRITVTLGAKGSAPITILCPFEPDRLVVDPDLLVLQLRRKLAESPLAQTP